MTTSKFYDERSALAQIAGAHTFQKFDAYSQMVNDPDFLEHATKYPYYAIFHLSTAIDLLPHDRRKAALLTTLASPAFGHINKKVPVAADKMVRHALEAQLSAEDLASSDIMRVRARIESNDSALIAAWTQTRKPRDDDWLFGDMADLPSREAPSVTAKPAALAAPQPSGSHGHSGYPDPMDPASPS